MLALQSAYRQGDGTEFGTVCIVHKNQSRVRSEGKGRDAAAWHCVTLRDIPGELCQIGLVAAPG